MDRKELVEALKDLMLHGCAETLADHALPCCRIELEPESELPVRRSKFGGIPDVPEPFQWPEFNDYPLHFVAQLDLADLPSGHFPELPRQGLLSFFYDCAQQPLGSDPSHRGAGRVFLFDEPVLRGELPKALQPDCYYAQCEAYFAPEANVPNSKSRLMKSLDVDPVELSRIAVIEATVDVEEDPIHQLLGHAFQIKEDMQSQCAKIFGDPDSPAELDRAADEWMLLFQCDTEPLTGWVWGEQGRLFFWIRKSDLSRQHFDDVWVIQQSFASEVTAKSESL